MGTVRVTKELKEQVQQEIVAALATYGRRADFCAIRARYPQVPKSSFYYWVSAAESSGIPQARALASVKASVAKDTVRLGSSEAVAKRDIDRLSKLLPAGPDVRTFTGLDVAAIASELQACVATAKKVAAFSESEDGRIRSPKMLLAASEHLRRTLDTASKLSETLFSIQASKDLIDSFVKVICTRDPEIARLIIEDLEAASFWKNPYLPTLAQYVQPAP